jgi:hypothetical protein
LCVILCGMIRRASTGEGVDELEDDGDAVRIGERRRQTSQRKAWRLTRRHVCAAHHFNLPAKEAQHELQSTRPFVTAAKFHVVKHARPYLHTLRTTFTSRHDKVHSLRSELDDACLGHHREVPDDFCGRACGFPARIRDQHLK